jgi:hypothetical protein
MTPIMTSLDEMDERGVLAQLTLHESPDHLEHQDVWWGCHGEQ